MAACPVCGQTDWHPPHEDLPVDEAVGVKSSQLLDEWEQVQGALQEKMSEAEDLARLAASIRNSLAARGITVTSDLPVLAPDDEDEVEAAPTPAPRAAAPAAAVPVAPSSKVLKGVTPKKREPTEDEPVVLGEVTTGGVKRSAKRAAQDEEREEELLAASREARITFQRAVDLPADGQANAEVAEIRRAAGEDVDNDSDVLSGFIANQLAQAASANGIK